MSEVDGATLIARSLKQQGIDHMFGIVGFPVGPIATAAQKEGINYVGMRHEMPATYAAQAVSYLSGRIGVALAVSGPGVLNAVGAFANAWSNRWPIRQSGLASTVCNRPESTVIRGPNPRSRICGPSCTASPHGRR